MEQRVVAGPAAVCCPECGRDVPIPRDTTVTSLTGPSEDATDEHRREDTRHKQLRCPAGHTVHIRFDPPYGQ